MRSRHGGQDAAGVGEGGLEIRPRRAEFTAHRALPHVGGSFRVIEQAPPHSIAVGVFLPVPPWIQRRVGVGAAPARDARPAPPLERERFHDLRAVAAAVGEGPGVRRGGQRVAPDQQALRAWPDAVQDTPRTVFAQQVAVAVAEEAARTRAELHESRRLAARAGTLLLADVGLVVRHAEVLGPVLRRDLHRLARAQRGVDHPLVHPLGVHVDLDLSAAGRHAVEYRLPELVASLLDPALAVDAEGDTADLRDGLEQRTHRVAAVGAVSFGSEAFDRVVRLRARDPLVAVHPDAQLELHAARRGLFADEAQHLQVAIAFGVGQLRHAHVVPGHGEQERIREQEVAVGDAVQEVVADAESEAEAVEALRGQHGEVRRPHLAVVVPGLVLDLAGEQPRDAADGVGRMLGNGRRDGQRGQRVGGVMHAVRQFKKRVRQAPRVVPARPDALPALPQCQGLGNRSGANAGGRECRRGAGRRHPGGHDSQACGRSLRRGRVHADGQAAFSHLALQLTRSPPRRLGGRHRVRRIDHDCDMSRLSRARADPGGDSSRRPGRCTQELAPTGMLVHRFSPASFGPRLPLPRRPPVIPRPSPVSRSTSGRVWRVAPSEPRRLPLDLRRKRLQSITANEEPARARCGACEPPAV